MECGDIETPPSKNCTVWGLIEIIIMCIIGAIALDNIIKMKGHYFSSTFQILLFSLNVCIVVALVLTIWGICALDGGKLKLGLILFLVCCIVDVIIMILFWNNYYFENILRIVVEIILAYILYKQSSKLG